MNTMIPLHSSPVAAPLRLSALRLLLPETRAEFLRLLRYPGFAIPTLAFPLMFYTLFGIILAGDKGGIEVARHMLASYSAFGVMAPGLFGIGVQLAIERERGFLQLKRVLPMPPGIYLAAKMLTSVFFAATVGILMMLTAHFAGHVALTARQCALLLACDVLGVLPFCAMGLLIGSYVSGSTAPALTNLVYLPMGFLSGLWFPVWMLPQVMQQVAALWPAYHLGQLSLQAVNSRCDGAALMHVAVLFTFTGVAFRLASRRLARG